MVDSGMLYPTLLPICTNNSLLAVDEFAGKEGLPAGADPEMNNIVNDEVNKL